MDYEVVKAHLKEQDIELVLDFLENRTDEFRDVLEVAPENRGVVREVLQDIVLHNKGFGYVIWEYSKIDGSKNIRGIVLLAIQNTWWSNKPFLTNLLYYVDPLHRRNKGYQFDLFKYCKALANLTSLPIYFDINRKYMNPVVLERFFKTQGCESMGFQVLYRPTNSS